MFRIDSMRKYLRWIRQNPLLARTLVIITNCSHHLFLQWQKHWIFHFTKPVFNTATCLYYLQKINLTSDYLKVMPTAIFLKSRGGGGQQFSDPPQSPKCRVLWSLYFIAEDAHCSLCLPRSNFCPLTDIPFHHTFMDRKKTLKFTLHVTKKATVTSLNLHWDILQPMLF